MVASLFLFRLGLFLLGLGDLLGCCYGCRTNGCTSQAPKNASYGW
jgi:hypothetical protein